MSDKSFGDNTNRNIVKNPLLSTAVTGLSLEDLTHNAVLFPVPLGQEVFPQQDVQSGPQTFSLGYTDHAKSNFQSGDANSHKTYSIPPKTQPNPYTQQSINPDKGETTCFTEIKALPKSEDDFDVNEYFARLQGTRYVSAPINLPKVNASLQDKEQNLEEINLNEPDKCQIDTSNQHSITADIAQNFSQLPTVLPQVANAVFSSFSNMLNMKSREVTPDDRTGPLPDPGYQKVQTNDNVQLGVPDFGNREVAPPPKEPPIVGTTSYRITSKKKYAQIPGLASAQTAPIYNPMIQSDSNPSYFIPTSLPANIPLNNDMQHSYDDTKSLDNRFSLSESHKVVADVQKLTKSEIQNDDVLSKAISHAQVDNTKKDTIYDVFNTVGVSNESQVTNQAYNIYNPAVLDPDISVDKKETELPEQNIAPPSQFYNKQQDIVKEHSNLPPQTQFNQRIANSQLNLPLPPQFFNPDTSTGPVLPPPPTFANLPPRDHQASAGRRFLPPSVARRLAGSQSVIKTAMPPSCDLAQNIFVPTSVTDETNSTTQSDVESIRPPSAFAQFNTPSSHGSVVCQTPANAPLTSESVFPSTLPLHIPPQFSTEISTPPLSISSVPMPPASPISKPIAPPMSSVESVTPLIFTPVPMTSNDQSSVTTLNPTPGPTTHQSSLPPTFFNPSDISSVAFSRNDNINPQLTAANIQQFSEHEAPKIVAEPPKVTVSQSYRLAKKRPQYYAGPIEGVGSISNNVKPIIAQVETSSFHGALFTPASSVTQENVAQVQQNLDKTSMPFDISQPVESIAPYLACNLNKDQHNNEPEYNIAFDMSRQTTDMYEPPKQESIGFGIIGSLKSKLGSLDINKLQNTVTTFFDPAYNEAKVDTANVRENRPYGPSDAQQQSNIEILVPNVDTSQYQYDYQTQNVYQAQFNRTRDEFNYYQNHSQNAYPSYYFQEKNQSGDNAGTNIHASFYSTSYNTSTENTSAPYYSNVDLQADNSKVFYQSLTSYPKDDIVTHKFEPAAKASQLNIANVLFDGRHKNTSNTKLQATAKLQIGDKTNEFKTGNEDFRVSSVCNKEIDLDKCKNVFALFDTPKHAIETKEVLSAFEKTPQESMFSNLDFETQKKMILSEIPRNQSKHVMQDNLNLNSFVEIKTQDTNVPSVPSGNRLQKPMVAEFLLESNTQEDSDTKAFKAQETEFKNYSLVRDHVPGTFVGPLKEEDTPITDCIFNSETSSAPLFGLSTMLTEKSKELADLENEISKTSLKEVNTIFNRNANVNFFDNLQSEQSLDDEGASDLNICFTCREVTKNEDDNEINDLTSKLIENITAPIQLSNPVEAPLPDDNIDAIENTDFDSTQCAEISRITEETIETIQIQSATELLDVDKINVRHYGWSSDESLFTTKVLPDHDYNIVTNPNPIEYFGNSAINENIPTNASDEIKAELILHDEPPVVLPRQMNIPSAPPAEDDSKSDETGIDVHSIEQDATQDFAYEEFVGEPAETDDDKIECRVRKSVDIQDLDSFASRVEKFKKMEEIITDTTYQTLDFQNTASPSLPLASYFDTGNYAAESHFRNSLTTPPHIGIIPSPQIRLPPGFEEQYERKNSSCQGHSEKPIVFTSETITQPLHLAMFDENEDVAFSNATLMAESLLKSSTPEKEKLQNFDNMFEVKSIQQTELNLPTFVTNNKLESVIKNLENIACPQEINADIQNVSQFSDEFEAKKKIDTFMQSPHSQEEDKTPCPSNKPVLPDPLNFFSTSTTLEPKSEDTDSKRLASYFASPAKTTPQKSFFELSRGQNHYRHKQTDSQKSNKLSFEPSQSLKHTDTSDVQDKHYNDNNKIDLQDIPVDRYIANLNLMKTLTHFDNLELNSDQTVRHVSYFTVELHNILADYKKGEPDIATDKTKCLKTQIEHKTEVNKNEDLKLNDNEKAVTIVKNCQYCCNLTECAFEHYKNINLVSLGGFNVIQCMDTDNSKDNKEIGNMEESKQSDKSKSVKVHFEDIEGDANDGSSVLLGENRTTSEYTPVQHHWFYRSDAEDKSTWRGFSIIDNKALEDAFNSPNLNDNTVVATDGGRYDVNIKGRLRIAVYWAAAPTNVMRCSWFYKGTTDARYVPYTEEVAKKLEEEYRHGITTGEWHRRLLLPNSELVVMHGPGVMVHFLQASSEALSPPPQPTMRPRVVRRGHDESEIEEFEPSHIDHLLLMCHGVGSACDMRFRSVEEVVDDFRATSLQLLQSHYKKSYANGKVGRVEVLPISWHATLHSGATGVDRRLERITLDSIPRLRNFTNDTVLDVLFYTSPVFCQSILETVCNELNRINKLFRLRNPRFQGGISLGGHSLGSVILYDLLCHQNTKTSKTPIDAINQKSYVVGAADTSHQFVRYPVLDFSPVALYALGSPIAIFETIRGVDTLGTKFSLPTCRHFFNIFHPYDPIAYRIEPLINPQLRNIKPYLIPHHKGRKRMHLELKETLARVSADIKQKLVESIKATWSSVWGSGTAGTNTRLEKVVEEEIEKEELTLNESKEESSCTTEATPELLGNLNKGRRVDYVLQEAPLEMINEYIFAMSSHVCYWESEDTMLLILREIYDSLGISPDSTVPQQNMSVERTRAAKGDETIVMEDSGHPSTSRSDT